MKKMLLVIMLFVSATNIFSQETYKSLLTEGKTWKVVTTNTSPIDNEEVETCIKLSGDTIVGGYACKILVHTSNEYTWKSVLLEEDRIIYRYDESTNEFLPLMDFNLHKGDKVGDWGFVLSEDSVEAKSINYRRLAIGYEAAEPLAYWVEGIGASKDNWITLFDTHIGEYSYMQECCENGKCIFSASDFIKDGISGITSPKVDSLKENTLYDLQGRKRSYLRKGDFIQNGKKYMKR